MYAMMSQTQTGYSLLRRLDTANLTSNSRDFQNDIYSLATNLSASDVCGFFKN